MLPKMISSTMGNPTPQIGPTRSRRNSLASVSVSLPSGREPPGTGTEAVIAPAELVMVSLLLVVSVVPGQRHKGVLQAGLLHPQLRGDDPVAGQGRRDRQGHVTGSGHDHRVAPVSHAGD